MDTILYFQSPTKTSAPDKIAGVRRHAAVADWHVQAVDGIPTSNALEGLVSFWHPLGIILDCGDGVDQATRMRGHLVRRCRRRLQVLAAHGGDTLPPDRRSLHPRRNTGCAARQGERTAQEFVIGQFRDRQLLRLQGGQRLVEVLPPGNWSLPFGMEKAKLLSRIRHNAFPPRASPAAPASGGTPCRNTSRLCLARPRRCCRRTRTSWRGSSRQRWSRRRTGRGTAQACGLCRPRRAEAAPRRA